MAFSSRSLVPSWMSHAGDWWDSWDVPGGRLLDQHFGSPLLDDDRRLPVRLARPFRRQLSKGGVAELRNESDAFQVMLDVSHFSPDEITVKTVDRSICVSAKHEERMDEHGYVSREFTRRYLLPDDALPESVSSTLTADGVLTVTAPKRPALSANERLVPINVQGGPAPLPVHHEP